ncbi:Acetokinase family-domain-containing protein [Diplogelasinospora grovesii]|uniref:Probable acetate kinase n=1 Tax=Diplogelasinospora grovesii TaxID=303347 RepID=A0AAN6S6J3_9PEZI|nr:Acetokinase family-domain-containing protein [Diplogelasinospora grovesii]
MAAPSGRSGSSSSSFGSSSRSVPPSYANYASPVDSTFTPTSAVSALTSESSAPQTPLGPLDLGPPGYHATIKLYERTPNETTVYLGPWEVIGIEPRRVVWSCSYQGETLEHFLPSDNPTNLFPYTLHAQHRRFGDPRDMELYLTFREPHRIRYTTVEGVVHDEFIEVKYEFTTVEGSIQFQSDIRRRDLIDWFDVDVVWSDSHRRTDSYGNVRGLGTIQRMKLWRDRYSTFHYLTFYANHRRRWKEYLVHDFDPELRHRDDRHRRLQLTARGARRGSAPESSHNQGRDRRFSASSIFSRPRHTSSSNSTHSGGGSSSSSSPTNPGGPDLRYLGIQFTRNDRAQPGSDGENIHVNIDGTYLPSCSMKKIILSVNAGSSSVKVSVYSAEHGTDPQQLAEAQLSGLTAPPAKLDYSRRGETISKDHQLESKKKIANQAEAFEILLKTLIDDKGLAEIKHKDDVGIVCHRIVHGGDYSKPQLISDGTYRHLEALNDLAPLHNANSLSIVQLCLGELLPRAKNVACFDSQFHATIPDHIRTYPISLDIAKSNKLRKYGFHGISYAFITRSVVGFLEKPEEEVNIIALHLGSGASACAIRGGKSWDTSMGLTPLAGLPGATRSGSVDPSLVFHYASGDVGKLSPNSTKELHISRAEEIMNQEAGWKALTGTTNFGAIAKGADEGDRKMKLAFDLVVDRICGFVGSYYVTLNGKVDALVFAGGIGEKGDTLRSAVVKNIACLGFAVDEGRNKKDEKHKGDVVRDITGKDARHHVLVCKTDEQFEMARGCARDKELW